ncbi:MAG: alpha-L-glutamate ligase, partial [Acidobacteriota bacterium]|nr:alpha-L-glutamate ligase [Acidobacteriota bacterium]
ASSHTRGHRYAPEHAAAALAWLERHGRRVLNGGRALQLELSKVAQYAALEALGIRTPRTVAVIGRQPLVEAARRFPPPFITKHNRAGKGLGVRLFHDAEALARYVESEAFEPSVDGITLLQEYIEAPEPFITRVEFVAGRFLYAVQVDTSQGFELCPADACRVDDTYCPAGEDAGALFRIVEGFRHPLVERYERVLAANDTHIAGIEFIVDRDGVAYTYDINTNTNYNSEAEEVAGQSGMGAIADYLGLELARLPGFTPRPASTSVLEG